MERVSESWIELFSGLEITVYVVNAEPGLELILPDLVGLISRHGLIRRPAHEPGTSFVFLFLVQGREAVLIERVLRHVVAHWLTLVPSTRIFPGSRLNSVSCNK